MVAAPSPRRPRQPRVPPAARDRELHPRLLLPRREARCRSRWLDALERHWAGANNLLHHLWWHRALFHLERREFAAVLDLYDRRFRDLTSPLAQAQPDFHIDIQNAASMLFRLERHDVPVGDRWIELADKAEKRIDDCRSPFTLPHWLMALAATGRYDAAQRMLDAMRAFSRGRSSHRAAGATDATSRMERTDERAVRNIFSPRV